MSVLPEDPAPAETTVTRRGVSRGLAAGAVTAAVVPLVGASPATAADAAAQAARSAAHARKCTHAHRCAKHPEHKCKAKHRCRHRFHQASTKPKTPTTPTTPPAPTKPPTSTPAPQTPPATPLPSAAGLHLGNRFSYAMTPALHAQMEAAGGHERWFESQLAWEQVADAKAEEFQGWWTSINLDHTAIAQRDKDGVEGGWRAMENYARWCLLRRIYSQRQVLEIMTEFWENHLHVPLNDDGVYTYRAQYGKVIRSHALGRFDQMLQEAITHPAMGISLDNASSTKTAPNENLGRELLELHTVGRGNHSEDDVKNSARILTGYRVDTWRTWNATYNTASHWTGTVKVLGFTHANTSADGQQVTREYLAYLARHPKTAERIARKLATRFVSDEPSAALVAHLASVYLANDTEIKPVLRALVASQEFKDSAGKKVRTPTDDVVATHRVLRTEIAKPVDQNSAANSILWSTTSIGQSPFAWARPDGPPEEGRAWSSASRVLASLDVHYSMAGTWWPKQDMTYRPLDSWLPVPAIRFDAFVDHLSQQLLGKKAPARLLQACVQVTGVTPETTITATHGLVRWNMPILLTTLLDTPDHMTR